MEKTKYVIFINEYETNYDYKLEVAKKYINENNGILLKIFNDERAAEYMAKHKAKMILISRNTPPCERKKLGILLILTIENSHK
ncbi:MAG: hypothetical protein HUU50_04255 [Candidatus Brocadiae bacterium]|nr:hypothetical protein [Candidatus Brocadiia bacterium]